MKRVLYPKETLSVTLATFEIITQNAFSAVSCHNLSENRWTDFDQILYWMIHEIKDWWQQQD
jgi:hypothetical protein